MDLRLLLQLIGIVAYCLISLKQYFKKKNIYDIIICTCKEKNNFFNSSPMEEPKYAVQLQIPDQSIAQQQQHALINENAMDTRLVKN